MFLALLAFTIVSYKKIVWGIASIITLLPIYLWRISIFSLPTTFLELMIVTLFIIWLIKDKRISKINFSLSKKAHNALSIQWRYLLIAWLFASLLALVINPTYSSLGLWRAYFLEPIMFFLVFVYSVQDKQDIRIIIKSMGLLALWLLVVALYQNFSNWNFIPAYNYPNIKRLTAVFSYPNALSLLIAPIGALFLGLWLHSQGKLKNIIYLFIFIVCFSLAVLSRSDGAVLALAITVVFWLILVKKARKIGIPLLLVLGFLASIVLPISRPSVLRNFELNPELNLQSSSLDIRLNQWQETAQMLGDHFFWGTGLGAYQKSLVAYHQNDWLEIYLYPHNIFLNFWTELGLFGLAVFLLMMFSIICLLKDIFIQDKDWFWPLAMMWLTWFVHGLVDVPYFKNDLSVLFFVMLGLTIVVWKNKK